MERVHIQRAVSLIAHTPNRESDRLISEFRELPTLNVQRPMVAASNVQRGKLDVGRSIRLTKCASVPERRIPQSAAWWRAGLLAVLLLGGCPFLRAQLPVPQLNTIFPAGGRAGEEIEVTLTGASMEEVRQLRFSGDGIAAFPVTSGTNRTPVPNKFRVAIPSNAMPGLFEARVVGRHGVSNPRAFSVGQLPECLDVSTNSTARDAQLLAVGSTVNGRAPGNAADFFRVRTRAGRALVVRCEAGEIDSRMLPAFELLDPDGRELGRGQGTAALWHRSDHPGEVVVRVHDFLYRGGDEFPYRLTVHEGPHVERVFPPSAQPGKATRFKLWGVNLPGSHDAGTGRAIGGLEQLEIETTFPAAAEGSALPRQFTLKTQAAGLDMIQHRFSWQQPDGSTVYSNPLLIGLASDPVVVAVPAVGATSIVQKLALPCEWVGVFPGRGKVAIGEFEARKDDRLWIEVFSHRMGLPTDPFAVIKRVVSGKAGAEELKEVKEFQDSEADFGGPEFRTDSRDFASRFEVPEEGVYRIELRDAFAKREPDPRCVFRVQLRRAAPDFRLEAVVSRPPPANRDQRIAGPWALALRRGESTAVRLLAFRRGWFDGEILLTVDGLPEGVTAAEMKIESGKNTGIVVLTAATNAPAWVGSVRVDGSATLGSEAIRRRASVGVVGLRVEDYNNEPVFNRLADDLVVSVHEEELAPLSVFAEAAGPVTVVTNGKVSIPIQVTRQGEFGSKLTLKPVGISALDKVKELVFEPGTNRAVLELDLSQTPLQPGLHVFALSGQLSGKYRPFVPGLTSARDEVKRKEDELAKLSNQGVDEKKKELESWRLAATERVKELEKQSALTDVFLAVISAPIRVEVKSGEARP